MTSKHPLISIIIPTKNSALYLKACLLSIREQTYKNIETIVVDNFSTDTTINIAEKYATKVFKKGPERSYQRNLGAKNARGEYIFFVDSDMELSRTVVADCVEHVRSDALIKALIVPEQSIGEGFWAKCKTLERSFYVGINFMEAARFYEKKSFLKVGGFDEHLISGEDWYLSQKLEKIGKIGRIESMMFHNEGKLSLYTTVKKKYYYARNFSQYMNLQDNLHLKEQTSVMKRYVLFLSQPKKLFKHPIIGLGMLFLKTCEFAFGGVGYLLSRYEQ